MTGALPSSPPNSTWSPTVFPGAGIRRTAVVLLLTMPMAASSAMIAEIVSAVVSPGTAIMSRPTEQTQVMASSLSRQSVPRFAAAIMPSSSLTGMKAPDRPPTWLDAMMPPFFTASFRSARAAVVPWVPQTSRPISSRMRATESPTAGVGARDRSTTPKGTPSRALAAWATIWPILVTRKAVRLIVSATTSKGWPRTAFSALCTTPGPETPTLMTHSGSPTPWKAPAMKGLSSTALAKTTSLAQPMPSASAVRRAVSLMMRPISATASMLMPAFVVATLTLEQTSSVVLRASGMDSIRRVSPGVQPLWTSALYPPMKLTPHSFAARSSARARMA